MLILKFNSMKVKFLLFVFFVFSQFNLAQEPVSFTTSVKKISDGTFELITSSKIEKKLAFVFSKSY